MPKFRSLLRSILFPKYQQTDTNIKLNTKYNIHYVHISKKMMFNDISMSY